ncbi:MAG: 23S rRNA pseudouridylate synthase B, partial [Gammaproteobacteria bacterium]|nr:23S rRNA pseudouridylate synthase B [Gammaproteobacteria bacterium]
LITDGGGQGTNHWYHVTLREGKNREVRRLWEAVDVEVSRLVRVRYQDFTLPKWLKPGKIRFLDDDVVVRLFESLQLEYPGENKNKILKVAKARDTSRRQRRRK